MKLDVQMLRDAWASLLETPADEPIGPIYLSPALYDAGVKAGHDMRGYAKTRPIPGARKSIFVRTEYPACMPARGGKCAICGTGDCTRRP